MYLATLGSHRVSGDQALIKKDAPVGIVRARVRFEEREFLVEVQLNRGSPNRAQVNKSSVKPRELPRYVSAVLFAPEDLALVKGDPAGRRRFLDDLLVQRAPRLASVFADYDRVLKQRNTLLKSARGTRVRDEGLATLDLWNDKLVALGSEIIEERARLVAQLGGPVREAYQAVAGEDHHPVLAPLLTIDGGIEDDDRAGSDRFDARETSPVQAGDGASDRRDARGPADGAAGSESGRDDVPTRFRAALERVARSERDRGLTLVGPHRDDVLFELNGLPAKGYASHGESWSFALALRLASGELLRRDSPAGDPILVLDDVFAELDQARRSRLAHAVGDYEQVLITSAVLDDVPGELVAHTVHISAGAIVDA